MKIFYWLVLALMTEGAVGTKTSDPDDVREPAKQPNVNHPRMNSQNLASGTVRVDGTVLGIFGMKAASSHRRRSPTADVDLFHRLFRDEASSAGGVEGLHPSTYPFRTQPRFRATSPLPPLNFDQQRGGDSQLSFNRDSRPFNQQPLFANTRNEPREQALGSVQLGFPSQRNLLNKNNPNIRPFNQQPAFRRSGAGGGGQPPSVDPFSSKISDIQSNGFRNAAVNGGAYEPPPSNGPNAPTPQDGAYGPNGANYGPQPGYEQPGYGQLPPVPLPGNDYQEPPARITDRPREPSEPVTSTSRPTLPPVQSQPPTPENLPTPTPPPSTSRRTPSPPRRTPAPRPQPTRPPPARRTDPPVIPTFTSRPRTNPPIRTRPNVPVTRRPPQTREPPFRPRPSTRRTTQRPRTRRTTRRRFSPPIDPNIDPSRLRSTIAATANIVEVTTPRFTLPPRRRTSPRINTPTDVPNRIRGKPHIMCEDYGIIFTANTFIPFIGSVFSQSHQDNPKCSTQFRGEASFINVTFPYAECGKPIPGARPNEALYSVEVAVSYTESIGSSSSRVQQFLARCEKQRIRYDEEDLPRRIDEALEELELVPIKVERKAQLPDCYMKVVPEPEDDPHFYGPTNGTIVKDTTIGSKLRIEFGLEPATEAYGFLVKNCKVKDHISGKEYLVIDENGCSTDINILQHPHYDTYHDLAIVHWHAFKVPDDAVLSIKCGFHICSEIEDNDGDTTCALLPTPPYCPNIVTAAPNSLLFDLEQNFVAKRQANEIRVGTDVCIADSKGQTRDDCAQIHQTDVFEETWKQNINSSPTFSSDEEEDWCVSRLIFSALMSFSSLLFLFSLGLFISIKFKRRKSQKRQEWTDSSSAGGSDWSSACGGNDVKQAGLMLDGTLTKSSSLPSHTSSGVSSNRTTSSRLYGLWSYNIRPQ